MEFQFSLKNINEAANLFWDEAREATVIAFHGSMGAGKTTFIHALCEVKGVQDTVSSPTFSIINEYNYQESGVNQKIFHLDLYRLKGEQEAVQAGVEDCLFSGQICLVEWPEKAMGIIPANALHAYIELVDVETRKLRTDGKIS